MNEEFGNMMFVYFWFYIIFQAVHLPSLLSIPHQKRRRKEQTRAKGRGRGNLSVFLYLAMSVRACVCVFFFIWFCVWVFFFVFVFFFFFFFFFCSWVGVVPKKKMEVIINLLGFIFCMHLFNVYHQDL